RAAPDPPDDALQGGMHDLPPSPRYGARAGGPASMVTSVPEGRETAGRSPARGALPLLDGGDLVENPRRPRLRLVGGEVHLLRVGAERIDVRRVEIEPQLLEAVGEFRLLLQVLGDAPRQ